MLIDTNIIISSLLEQNDYQNARKFLSILDRTTKKFFMSEFSFYTICIQLTKRKKETILPEFINKLIAPRIIKLLTLNPSEAIEVINNTPINLDFDDKLQYYFCKKKNLQLVSYDTDFDKTDLGRLTPIQAIAQILSP